MTITRSAATGVTDPDGVLAVMRARLCSWARAHYEVVAAAAEFADGGAWAAEGAVTAAHWLADVADIEICTAREWIRVGRQLQALPASADAFERGELSYAKVRALTRFATASNEGELLAIARTTPASDLNRALAAWLATSTSPEELADHQRARRSLTSRLEPDGMTIVSARLPPLAAGTLTAALDHWLMTNRPTREPDGSWPTVAQQRADGLLGLLTTTTQPSYEVVLHVRGDGCSLDDGTAVPDTVVERIAPSAFLRALIHSVDGDPVDTSPGRRHPSTRQRRVVRERSGGACVDCGRQRLLHYDHVPDFAITGQTVTGELELRCAPCHRRRHRDC